MRERVYACIDLKSFYASVECVERGLDPLNTNLVVADETRTDKTICLAVSPALKSFGVPGRPRLFEVKRQVEQINRQRLLEAPGHTFRGQSDSLKQLSEDTSLALTFLVAPPRMARYMDVSAEIVQIYLQFVSIEHLVVYSVDEVFIDITDYLAREAISPHDFVMRMMREVIARTGITATAGIGTNLYLAKIAMDITAKHMPADSDGVRIAQLDEQSYRETLWSHRPLTDFWRVGRGTAKKLEQNGLFTMGDVALCSVGPEGAYHSEPLLYSLFGVNAELLIDHAWGYEPCTIADIKAYRPATKSLSSGQVLSEPYPYEKAMLVVREMARSLSEELLVKRLLTDQLVLTVGYDAKNLTDPARRSRYGGPVATDRYGRPVPVHAHGTENLSRPTSSAEDLIHGAAAIFERTVDPSLWVRRITLAACRLTGEDEERNGPVEQMSLFEEPDAASRRAQEEKKREKERCVQQTVLAIKRRFGKNAVVQGNDLEEGATAMRRNAQIGGHKA